MAQSGPDIYCQPWSAPERKADLLALGLRGPLLTDTVDKVLD